MQQPTIIYLIGTVATHITILLAMAILLTVLASLRSFLGKEKKSDITSLVFKSQIRFLLIFLAVSSILTSISLLLPSSAAAIIFKLSLIVDVAGPLVVFLKTLKTGARQQ